MTHHHGIGRSRGNDQRGQALVEFALVVPVFLLAVFGLIDVGRLVYTNSALSQAAREGARLAATEVGSIGATLPACVSSPSLIGASNPGAQVCPANVTAFKAHVVEAVNRMTVSLGPINAVHVSCDPDGSTPSGGWTEVDGGNGCQDGSGSAISASGDLVSVRIEYTYQPVTPVISSLISSVPLSSSATMIIHKGG
jgi:Flp pilus assembly protein TadG